MKMLEKIALIAFTVTLFCLWTVHPALSQQVDELKPIYVCQVTDEGSMAIVYGDGYVEESRAICVLTTVRH